MAQTSSLLPALLTLGFLTILGYCVVTFSNAVSTSILNADTAKGSFAYSQQQFSVTFETARLNPRSAPPPVRVLPKAHQAPPRHHAREVQHRCRV